MRGAASVLVGTCKVVVLVGGLHTFGQLGGGKGNRAEPGQAKAARTGLTGQNTPPPPSTQPPLMDAAAPRGGEGCLH